MNDTKQPTKGQSSRLMNFLSVIERAGNKLPDSIVLFIYGMGLVVLLSVIASWLGLSITDPRPAGVAGRAADGLITTKNLLNADGIRYMLTSLIPNFVNFAPLGTVLVCFLSIGIAEKSGLIQAVLTSLVKITPKSAITSIVVLAGVLSHMAMDLGYLVIIPLGAIVFYGFGKHPIAGLVAAFAGVSGGFSANLLVGPTDIILSGITQEASKLIDPTYKVGPEVNWYFMMASTVLIVFLGTIITDKLITPMLGKFDEKNMDKDHIIKFGDLNSLEKLSLKLVGLFSLVFIGILYISVKGDSGILLNQTTKTLAGSPFFASIVSFIFLYFTLAGLLYGFVSKNFKETKDVVSAMTWAMTQMAYYITIAFFMAQFISYFAYTNLGIVLAVSLADFVKSLDIGTSGFVVSLIFITAFMNLFIGSASAKWALLSPIFVPMFMLLGYSPEVVQVAYRIGDSATNIISPLLPYIPLIIVMAQKYSKNFGMGNLLALMLPYSISFLVLWSIMFYVWVFVLGIPVGPNVSHLLQMIK